MVQRIRKLEISKAWLAQQLQTFKEPRDEDFKFELDPSMVNKEHEKNAELLKCPICLNIAWEPF